MKGKGKAGLAVRRIAGTMSGTSMDGVDLAVLDTDGEAILGFGETRYRPYSDAERGVLRAALGAWPGDPRTTAAESVVEAAHLEVMDGLDVDLFGFHGQTLAHDPGAARTHQAGSGARIARALGRPVAWDFRSADMRAGGQGAPLAPFYHWALARRQGAAGPLAVLNLGGVGNLTWLDPDAAGPDAPGALLAFDTGPANGPMDDAMRARGLGAFDEGGARAARGRADADAVAAFLNSPYFSKKPPKSLDRLDFQDLLRSVSGMGDADALATLVAAAVQAVVQGIARLPAPPTALWVAGGGRRNRTVMAGLAAALPFDVVPVDDIGLDGDALEAQAFAYLAARVAADLTLSAPGTTGVAAPATGGLLARP